MDKLQTAILSYQPNDKIRHLLGNTRVILLVGPTGSGKNTLENKLLETGEFKPIVTHTTRKPRTNQGVLEQDGQEYYFVSEAQALDMLRDHKFIEAAFTHEDLYGTSIDEFATAKKQGKVAVADIDIKGVRSYKQLTTKVVAIFLLPPSFKVLIDRLIRRYGKANDQLDIKVRLATALDELSELLNTDYYYAVINEDMDVTKNTVLDIINGNIELKPNPKALKLAQQIIDDIKDYLAE